MAGMQIHQGLFWYHKHDSTTYSQPQSYSIDDNEDQMLGVISSGAYGVVHKALNTETRTIVAMKEELEGLSATTAAQIDILKTLGPQRIAMARDRVLVVMDYVKSDLERRRWERRKPYSLKEIMYIIEEILKGVAFLHDSGVMHRDLKPSNILIGNKAEIKICDFGLSARFGSYPGR